jgi:hypothetical protein
MPSRQNWRGLLRTSRQIPNCSPMQIFWRPRRMTGVLLLDPAEIDEETIGFSEGPGVILTAIEEAVARTLVADQFAWSAPRRNNHGMGGQSWRICLIRGFSSQVAVRFYRPVPANGVVSIPPSLRRANWSLTASSSPIRGRLRQRCLRFLQQNRGLHSVYTTDSGRFVMGVQLHASARLALPTRAGS